MPIAMLTIRSRQMTMRRLRTLSIQGAPDTPGLSIRPRSRRKPRGANRCADSAMAAGSNISMGKNNRFTAQLPICAPEVISGARALFEAVHSGAESHLLHGRDDLTATPRYGLVNSASYPTRRVCFDTYIAASAAVRRLSFVVPSSG